AQEVDWYVLVRSDNRRQVFEGAFGANRANNLAASAGTLTVGVPELTLDTPAGDQFDAPGEDRYFKITLAPVSSLRLTLAGSPGNSLNRILVRRDALPRTYQNDFSTPVSS